MADYPGANSPATMQGNLKEIYNGKRTKKDRFSKIKNLIGK